MSRHFNPGKMERYTFYIKINSDVPSIVRNYYENYTPSHIDDSGFDLPTIDEYTISPGIHRGTPLKFGISGCMVDNMTGGNVGYYLYPRSSFHKTPLIVGNHVGIIDAGYRGSIMGMVKNLDTKEYCVDVNTKLFQICAPDLSPFRVKVVDTLPSSSRGEGGFGSTGK
jgi:dUTP pyrophosphatase